MNQLVSLLHNRTKHEEDDTEENEEHLQKRSRLEEPVQQGMQAGTQQQPDKSLMPGQFAGMPGQYLMGTCGQPTGLGQFAGMPGQYLMGTYNQPGGLHPQVHQPAQPEQRPEEALRGLLFLASAMSRMNQDTTTGVCSQDHTPPVTQPPQGYHVQDLWITLG